MPQLSPHSIKSSMSTVPGGAGKTTWPLPHVASSPTSSVSSLPRSRQQNKQEADKSAALRKLRRIKPRLTVAILAIGDMLSFLIAGAAGCGIAWAVGWDTSAVFWLIAAAGSMGYVILGALVHLYPGLALTPEQQVRKMVLASTTMHGCLVIAALAVGQPLLSALVTWSTSWLISIAALCLTRVWLYHRLSPRPWWGCPVVLIGKAEATGPLIRGLRLQPSLGLKPVAVLDSSRRHPQAVEGVRVFGGLDQAHRLYQEFGVRYAIVAGPHGLSEELAARLGDRVDDFPHLLVIPRGFDMTGPAPIRSLGGAVGVEVAQRLLRPGNHFFKAGLDCLMAAVFFVLSLPLFAMIAVCIKFDSPGPVFYRHKRIGFGGHYFPALKFRTMVQNADDILADYLRDHPECRAEWERSHKLRNDPRVTRVGRLLRKPSLDELPQLWNVLRGEMSVIGPRPIVDDEADQYGRSLSLYRKVRPGITGLWQVSGRSDTTFRERVCMDAYYVRNWSIWLDGFILARTLVVVLFGRGAY